MTTTTTTETPAGPEVAGYLDEVAAHLAGLAWLPEPDRAELLDDLARHLAEVAAEGGAPLAEQLGPPARYAEELLTAAGLEAPGADGPGPGHGPRTMAAALDVWRRLRETAVAARDLEPAWWVLRGYLAASLLCSLSTGFGRATVPVPDFGGSRLLGLVAVAVAVRQSVLWGRQGRPARRWVRRVATWGLALYGVVLLGNLGEPRVEVQWVDTGTRVVEPGCLRNGAGEVVDDLYPYGPDGRLLDPVLLYDQNGRPLDNVCSSAVPPLDENGAPVANAFPRRSRPDAAADRFGPPPTSLTREPPPAVVVPRLGGATTTATTTTTTTTTAEAPATVPAATVPAPPTG